MFLSRLIVCLASALAVGFAPGCAADPEGDAPAAPPSELVSPAERNVALAMIRDGDSIYVARPLRLDRLDARTGEIVQVAGPEWAECPRDRSIVWMSSPIDFTYPSLVVRGTTVYLVQDDCGLWSFDLGTKKARMLVDPSIDAKLAVRQATGVYPDGALWNGKDGPRWSQYFGMAIAADGDGLVGCFQTFVQEPYPDSPGVPGYRNRLELWSIATDGTPRELLAFIPRERAYDDGEDYCRQVVPDGTGLLIGTEKAVLRWDRTTRALTPLAGGFRYGTDNLAADATDIYFEKDNAIVKVPRTGGPITTLVPTSHKPDEPVRMVAAIDGDHVYFQESYALKRMKKDGTDRVDFAPGTVDEWVMPLALGITDTHVYFQKISKLPGTGVMNPSTGERVDTVYQGALRRTRK